MTLFLGKYVHQHSTSRISGYYGHALWHAGHFNQLSSLLVLLDAVRSHLHSCIHFQKVTLWYSNSLHFLSIWNAGKNSIALSQLSTGILFLDSGLAYSTVVNLVSACLLLFICDMILCCHCHFVCGSTFHSIVCTAGKELSELRPTCITTGKKGLGDACATIGLSTCCISAGSTAQIWPLTIPLSQ